MIRKAKIQKGFSIAEVMVLIVVLGILSFAGWVVWNRSRQDDSSSYSFSSTEEQNASSSEQQTTTYVDYSNQDLNLSLNYPSSWTLGESISNTRGLGSEGAITLTSPNGLILHINPNYGGRGGSCDGDPTDTPHDTKNCGTLEILSKEKTGLISDMAQDKDVYLYEVKYTAGRQDGPTPDSIYSVFLSNNSYLTDAQDPLIGAWFAQGLVSNVNQANIDTFITPSDKLTNESVLQSSEMQQIKGILRSLK